MEFRDRYRFLRRKAAALAQGRVIAPALPLLCTLPHPAPPVPAPGGKAAGYLAVSGSIALTRSLHGAIHCRVCNGDFQSRSGKPGATGSLLLNRLFRVLP